MATSSSGGTAVPPDACRSGAACSTPTRPTRCGCRGSTRRGSPTDGRAAPPPTDPDGWIDATADIAWRFRTAPAAGEAVLLEPVDLRGEAVFDPRAVSPVHARPSTRPAGTRRPTSSTTRCSSTSRSTTSRSCWSCYGRTLSCPMQRTDPPPGTAGSDRTRMSPDARRPLAGTCSTPADARLRRRGGRPALRGSRRRSAGPPPCSATPSRSSRGPATTCPRRRPGTASAQRRRAHRRRQLHRLPLRARPADLLAALGCTDADLADPAPRRRRRRRAAPGSGGPRRPATPPWTRRSWSSASTRGRWRCARVVVALWRPRGRRGARRRADRGRRAHRARRRGSSSTAVSVGGVTLDVVRARRPGARILATPSAPLTLAAEDVLTVVLTSTTLGADGSTVVTEPSRAGGGSSTAPPRLPGGRMSIVRPCSTSPGRRRLEPVPVPMPASARWHRPGPWRPKPSLQGPGAPPPRCSPAGHHEPAARPADHPVPHPARPTPRCCAPTWCGPTTDGCRAASTRPSPSPPTAPPSAGCRRPPTPRAACSRSPPTSSRGRGPPALGDGVDPPRRPRRGVPVLRPYHVWASAIQHVHVEGTGTVDAREWLPARPRGGELLKLMALPLARPHPRYAALDGGVARSPRPVSPAARRGGARCTTRRDGGLPRPFEAEPLTIARRGRPGGRPGRGCCAPRCSACRRRACRRPVAAVDRQPGRQRARPDRGRHGTSNLPRRGARRHHRPRPRPLAGVPRPRPRCPASDNPLDVRIITAAFAPNWAEINGRACSGSRSRRTRWWPTSPRSATATRLRRPGRPRGHGGRDRCSTSASSPRSPRPHRSSRPGADRRCRRPTGPRGRATSRSVRSAPGCPRSHRTPVAPDERGARRTARRRGRSRSPATTWTGRTRWCSTGRRRRPGSTSRSSPVRRHRRGRRPATPPTGHAGRAGLPGRRRALPRRPGRLVRALERLGSDRPRPRASGRAHRRRPCGRGRPRPTCLTTTTAGPCRRRSRRPIPVPPPTTCRPARRLLTSLRFQVTDAANDTTTTTVPIPIRPRRRPS